MKQGWERKTLGDVLEVLRNGVNCKQDKKGIGEKISRIESISSGEFDIEKVGYTSLSYAEKEKYKLQKGDILFSHINSPIHVGKTALFDSDEEIYHGVNLLLMRPKSFLDKVYFEHYLKFLFQNGYWKGLCKQSVNQASVNQQDINKVEVTYPKSLPEQQRIVSILDKAFAAIDKAKANAEQNLKNAKELFESYLQGVFENGNWETKKIQEVTKVINGYAFASKDFKPTNTIKSIKITNVGVKEFIEEADNYLPEKFKDTLKEVQVREGNIVIALTRTIISAGLKVAVVPESYDGALVNQRVAALIPKGNLINQKYVYYYLTTSGVAKYVLEHVNTLMQPNLSINDLKNLPIPCPNLKDQQTIVRQLDALRAETQKLEAVYQKKIDDLEELKKSILQKAFAGELKTEKSRRDAKMIENKINQ
ncbi:MAG: restriction endonuclease subunit S [Bacteroidia bacterium]|nr:restriction endonuclease subunit S [Bacteroidia bacterium]